MLHLSLIQIALETMDVAPQELQIADPQMLLNRRYPALSVDRPAIVGPLTTAVCEKLGALLQLAYPINHPITVIRHMENNEPDAQSLPLGQLAQAVIGQGTAMCYLPPLAHTGAIETFQGTVAHLRAPDGCPWDRKQTHPSLRQDLLEETYEVLDALDRQDLAGLQEELGDVLLQILMQTQIAAEAGEFYWRDVVGQVNAKIVRRHPHVFADLSVSSVDEVLDNWQKIKKQEKGVQAQDRSVLDGVLKAMPALARAQSLQRHAERLDGAGASASDMITRIAQKMAILDETTTPGQRQAVLGELLFDLADLARMWDMDAESTLREASNRFEQRFREREKVMYQPQKQTSEV